jgi:hypothetical protein
MTRRERDYVAMLERRLMFLGKRLEEQPRDSARNWMAQEHEALAWALDIVRRAYETTQAPLRHAMLERPESRHSERVLVPSASRDAAVRVRLTHAE